MDSSSQHRCRIACPQFPSADNLLFRRTGRKQSLIPPNRKVYFTASLECKKCLTVSRTCGSSVCVDAVLRDLDFSDPTERKQQFDKVLGRLLRGLFHYVADSVGNCCLKHHTLGLQTSEIHTNELAHLQHYPCRKMLSPSETKCKLYQEWAWNSIPG